MASALTLMSFDPGVTTGVVALRVEEDGIRLIWAGEVLESSPMLLPLQASQRTELTDVLIEAEPNAPHHHAGVRRAREVEMAAATEGLTVFRYSPSQWKPAAKKLILRYPQELRSRHVKDAYGIALIHLRGVYARNFPFVKEVSKPWYLPVG